MNCLSNIFLFLAFHFHHCISFLHIAKGRASTPHDEKKTQQYDVSSVHNLRNGLVHRTLFAWETIHAHPNIYFFLNGMPTLHLEMPPCPLADLQKWPSFVSSFFITLILTQRSFVRSLLLQEDMHGEAYIPYLLTFFRDNYPTFFECCRSCSSPSLPTIGTRTVGT